MTELINKDAVVRVIEETGADSNRNENTPDFYDDHKLKRINRQIAEGKFNYLIFQKCPTFKWPYWVSSSLNRTSDTFDPLSFPMLINSSHRDWVRCTNMLSSDALLIDRCGMISTTFACCSIETWVLMGEMLLRPQENGVVNQIRDGRTGILNTIWKERDFELHQSLFGNKTSIDECVLETTVNLKKTVTEGILLVAIRPYDNQMLGGVRKLEYRKESRQVRVNGIDRICFVEAPDFIVTGSVETGDIISLTVHSGTPRIECSYGMATLAAGFPLRKGENRQVFRIGLNGRKNIQPVRFQYDQVKENYTALASMRIEKGFRLSFPDRHVQRWAYGAKGTILNFLYRHSETVSSSTVEGMREIYHLISACNRMGYFPEAEKILVSRLDTIGTTGARDFENAIKLGYYLISFADYFSYSREFDILQKNFTHLKTAAQRLFEYSTSVKSLATMARNNYNTLEHYLMRGGHYHDLILLNFALRQYAYLARCIGIFGEELRFLKETQRLDAVITGELNSMGIHIEEKAPVGKNRSLPGRVTSRLKKFTNEPKSAPGVSSPQDDFYGYLLFGGYPFHCESFNPAVVSEITKRSERLYEGYPLYLKSLGGWDVVLSLVYSVNLLMQRDPRYYSILERFMCLGSDRLVLPDFINPKTGSGVKGEGDSPVAVSLLFSSLRSILFMDFENRLDLFPCPREEWFQPGKEIVVENAPSRFGPINFRVISSSNEVQLRFTELPKFNPPEIMITLPFKAKIIEEDDFIIKKIIGNVFIINGWPSLIRFLR